MTIDQILRQVEVGNRITARQLERLERRRRKVVIESERLDRVLDACYVDSPHGRRTNPDLVHDPVFTFNMSQ